MKRGFSYYPQNMNDPRRITGLVFPFQGTQGKIVLLRQL